jgi:hypothetical protein
VLCKRLGCLLGSLSPGLQSLQLDWVCMNMETCSSLACWLSLTHLSLVSVNSQDVHGNWPSYTVTYNDIGLLTSLQRLEIIDSHLPFLELGVSDISGLTSLTRLESLHLVYSERAHGWPGSKPCYLLLGLDEVGSGKSHSFWAPPSCPLLRSCSARTCGCLACSMSALHLVRSTVDS